MHKGSKREFPHGTLKVNERIGIYMKHTDIDVAAVARMAKLELTAEEMEHYHGELCSLVDFCSALSVFDGEKSTARSVFIPLEQLRADKPLEDDSIDPKGGEYISLPFKTVSDEV